MLIHTIYCIEINYAISVCLFIYAVNLCHVHNSVVYSSMGHIHYSHIRDIFALSPCAVGFALRNVRDIYILQMALGVFSVIVAR